MSKMKITVFGEILWDVFDSERKIGGAPFNFAAHTVKLGGDAQLVSAVGKDELGEAAIEAAKALGIKPDSISVIDKPTGYCKVTLNDGTPSYNLVQGVAYDHIPMPSEKCDGKAFYFGTLAQRNEASAKTLSRLLEGDFDEVFFDINIRQNYYNDQMIDHSLKSATILKISREEIEVLGIEGDEQTICKELTKRYSNLKLIIVTLDKDGAFVYRCESGEVIYSPKPQSKAISTVGAGDSFSACFLCHYLEGESIEDCLYKATALSDFVVTQLGAVPDYTNELKAKISL